MEMVLFQVCGYLREVDGIAEELIRADACNKVRLMFPPRFGGGIIALI